MRKALEDMTPTERQSEIFRRAQTLQNADVPPTEDEIAQAPILENWFLARAMGTTIVSGETDHPELGAGRIMTSLVIAMNVDAGWMRSNSRVYRLGHQLRYDDPIIAEQSRINGLKLDDIRLLSKRINSNRDKLDKRLNALIY
jgi:hypothetical protein